MSHFLHRISNLGPEMENLVAAAIGCFVFKPDFRLVATGEKELERKSPVGADARSSALSIGIGAAIILMVFITSEALATIVVLRH